MALSGLSRINMKFFPLQSPNPKPPLCYQTDRVSSVTFLLRDGDKRDGGSLPRSRHLIWDIQRGLTGHPAHLRMNFSVLLSNKDAFLLCTEPPHPSSMIMWFLVIKKGGNAARENIIHCSPPNPRMGDYCYPTSTRDGKGDSTRQDQKSPDVTENILILIIVVIILRKQWGQCWN